MFLRRAIQVSVVIIYWLVIVPVIAKYLKDIKWMPRHRWTQKKFGFYGTATVVFIFIYSLCMYAYMLYKRWERKNQTDMKQSVSKAAKSKVPSAATSMATVAELKPLKRIWPTRPAITLYSKQGQQQQRPTDARSKVKILRSPPKNPPPPPPSTSLPGIFTTRLAPLQEQHYGSVLGVKNKRLSHAEGLTTGLADKFRHSYRMSTNYGGSKAPTTMVERV